METEKGYFGNLWEARISEYRRILVEFLEKARNSPKRMVMLVHRPSLESSITASILASSLETSGIRVVMLPSHEAPQDAWSLPLLYVDVEPLGRGEELYIGSQASRAASQSIVVESGLPATMALVLDGVAPLSTHPRLAAIASAYILDRDKGDRRDLVGPEREVASRTEEIKPAFTLLVWDLHSQPLASALSSTILPYYPGLTGSEENARRILGEYSINPDALYRSLGKDETAALIKLLVDTVSREYARKPREPRSIVAGFTYYYLGSRVLPDLRELALILEALHYTGGPGQILLYAVVGEEHGLRRAYLNLIPRIVELVEKARLKPGVLMEARVAGRKAWIHSEAHIGDPLTLASRALRLMGVIGDDQAVATGDGALPLEEALRTGLYPLPPECVKGYERWGTWIILEETCIES